MKWMCCPTKKIEREMSGMRHQKSTAFFQTESHDQNQFNELCIFFFNGVEWKGQVKMQQKISKYITCSKAKYTYVCMRTSEGV